MASKIEEALRSTARSATYNVVLQVSFRLLTFIVNALVLRYISSELLGLVNVRLVLLYSTILFLSREAFRKACLSRPLGLVEKNWRQIINLVWCCLPVGVFTALTLGLLWIYCLEGPSHAYANQYPQAVFVFCLSGVSELIVEPLWLISQEFMFTRARVLIEATALALKCFSTILLIMLFPESALSCFCAAQLIHTAVYTCLYYLYFLGYAWKQKKSVDTCQNTDKRTDKKLQKFPIEKLSDVLPKVSSKDDSFIDHVYGRLVYSFLKQSILKQFLTEGEKYVMTIFSIISFEQQGIYDVVNNLGSLIARFVFLPIEESYYVLFSQIMVRGGQDGDKGQLDIARKILYGILKFVSLVGYIILVFGYAYSYLALDIYGGKLLSSSEGPKLLRWYSVYVLIIAINGITECFMFASMSKDEVDRYNVKLVVFSFIFLAASLGLTKVFGSVGFILANCINMALRIIYSCIFIQKFFASSSRNPLRGMLPSKTVSMSLVISFTTIAFSERIFCCESGWFYRLIHIGIGDLPTSTLDSVESPRFSKNAKSPNIPINDSAKDDGGQDNYPHYSLRSICKS